MQDGTKMRPNPETLLGTKTLDREALVGLFHHMAEELHQSVEITHAYTVFRNPDTRQGCTDKAGLNWHVRTNLHGGSCCHSRQILSPGRLDHQTQPA